MEELQQNNSNGFSAPIFPNRRRTIASVKKVSTNRNNQEAGRFSAPNVSSDSTETDTIPEVYLFNFADDRGFAIVSGDDRVPGVLGYSGDGNLGDTIDNPGTAIALLGIADYMESEIEKYEQQADSIFESTLDKLIDLLPEEEVARIEDSLANEYQETSSLPSRAYVRYDRYSSYRYSYYRYRFSTRTSTSYGTWEVTSSKNPIVQVRWGQGRPYNSLCPDKNCTNNTQRYGERTPTGCVATALAQIFSHWKHPRSYGGVTYDWQAMINLGGGRQEEDADISVGTPANQTAHLMRNIGNVVFMDFDCKESGASDQYVYWRINIMGYYPHWPSYSSRTIERNVRNNIPVYISGCANRKRRGWWIFSYWHHQNCHAWVIDGVRNRRRKVTRTTWTFDRQRGAAGHYTTSYSYYQTQRQFHCNFGWDGGSNRWYVDGAFAPSSNRNYSNYQRNIMIFEPIR